MNRYITLFRREFWENQVFFVFVPVAIAAMLVVLMVAVLLTVEEFSVAADSELNINGNVVKETRISDGPAILGELMWGFVEAPEWRRRELMVKGLHLLAAPLQVLMLFVMFFYLLDSLYEERRDRSILFWKSLPVSDLQTVLAKLLSGLILMPLCYLGVVVALQVVVLAIMSLVSVVNNVDGWMLMWNPMVFIVHWGRLVFEWLVYLVWLFPVIGWLTLVSSWAKSMPLIWFLLIPAVIGLCEFLLLDSRWFSGFLESRLNLGLLGLHQDGTIGQTLDVLVSGQGLLGLLLGAAMIGLAVRQRSLNSEF